MIIGVIGAMQIEIDNLKKTLKNPSYESISGVEFVKGNIGDTEVVAAVSGVGKVFAAICTEAMILTYHVDMVINIGVAGTLCKELGVMGIAVADMVKVGTIATGDMFMHDKHQKDKLHERFNAIAAEMEGGSIGHVCYVNKVPFAILRTISDGEGGAMDYATFAEKAAQIGIEIVVEFIQKIA